MMLPRPGDIPEEALTSAEKKGLQRAAEFPTTGNAYALEHGTRPATIGLVLSSSPLALLAWIGEKFQHWTDKDPSFDAILGSVTLYWFTQSFPRCIYPYRQYMVEHRSFHADPKYKLKKPTGFSWFPLEIMPVPKEWAQQTCNLKLWRAHDEVSLRIRLSRFLRVDSIDRTQQGGHFAAMEKPDVLLQDVEDFVNQVWSSASRP